MDIGSRYYGDGASTGYSNVRDIANQISTTPKEPTCPRYKREGIKKHKQKTEFQPICDDCGSPVFTSKKAPRPATLNLEAFYKHMSNAIVSAAWESHYRVDRHGNGFIAEVVQEISEPWFASKLLCEVVLGLHHDEGTRAVAFRDEMSRQMQFLHSQFINGGKQKAEMASTKLGVIKEASGLPPVSEEREIEEEATQPPEPIPTMMEGAGASHKILEPSQVPIRKSTAGSSTGGSASVWSDDGSIAGNCITDATPLSACLTIGSTVTPAPESTQASSVTPNATTKIENETTANINNTSPSSTPLVGPKLNPTEKIFMERFSTGLTLVEEQSHNPIGASQALPGSKMELGNAMMKPQKGSLPMDAMNGGVWKERRFLGKANRAFARLFV